MVYKGNHAVCSFWDWLLILSIMHLKFIHVVMWVEALHFFSVVFILCMLHCLSPVTGHQDYFQLEVIMKVATVNILISVFVWTFFFSFSFHLGEPLGCVVRIGSICLTLHETTKLVSKLAVPFCIPSTCVSFLFHQWVSSRCCPAQAFLLYAVFDVPPAPGCAELLPFLWLCPSPPSWPQ